VDAVERNDTEASYPASEVDTAGTWGTRPDVTVHAVVVVCGKDDSLMGVDLLDGLRRTDLYQLEVVHSMTMVWGTLVVLVVVPVEQMTVDTVDRQEPVEVGNVVHYQALGN
jgi:hypothetical protein